MGKVDVVLVGCRASGGRAGAFYGTSTHMCPLVHWMLVPSLLVKFNEARLCHSSKIETFWLSVADVRLTSCSHRFRCDHSGLTFLILFGAFVCTCHLLA